MPFTTDQLLKSYLDANQLGRERMCLALLAIDKRFSDVRPRHPRGGPDGGRDIEAIYRQDQTAYGAVGFINEANDSAEQKRRIEDKFRQDLAAALAADPKPTVFVFFTNLNFTIGEKATLTSEATAAGISHSEIFDRERMRISLDSPDGFAIRFQYLNKPLSPEEQATFFARWGDDIQSVVSTGFQRLERTLNRVLFLQEASDVLDSLRVHYELDREYTAAEIGHFRAFCYVHRSDVTQGLIGMVFGSTDKAYRFSPDPREKVDLAGIAHGIATGKWELRFPDDTALQSQEAESTLKGTGVEQAQDAKDDHDRFVFSGYSYGIGMEKVQFLTARFDHGDRMFRFGKFITLKDLDGASLMPIINFSLWEKVKAIHIYANGYKLYEIQRDEIRADTSPLEIEELWHFTDAELADSWVRLRPHEGSSNFHFEFRHLTPRRVYSPLPVLDSLAKPATSGETEAAK